MIAKNLACTTLFCALIVQAAQATPVFTVTPGGLVSGNRQWTVSVTPDASLFANSGPNGTPPNTVGGSVATEFGFMVGPGSLVNIVKDATNFPNDNPGAVIPGFPNGFGVQMSGNKATAFLGSDFFTSATPHLMVTITTLGSGPTTLTWLGAYSGKGRIAQGGSTFDLYSGSVSSVPEPASCVVALLGLTGACLGSQRRFR